MKGFCYLLFSNIKRMLKHHRGIFCIVAASLLFSGMAVGIYYQMSSQVSAAQERMYGTRRSVELHTGAYLLDAEKLYDCCIAYLTGENNSAERATAISYELADYDIIGTDGYAVTHVMTYGDEYYGKPLDYGEIIVPLSFVRKNMTEEDSAAAFIGKNVKLLDRSFIIVGIYDDVLYDASLMDIRRVSNTDYLTSGEGVTLTNDNVEREAAGVYISMKDYIELGLSTESFRIRFEKTLSEHEIDSIRSNIFSAAVFDPMGDEYSEVDLLKIYHAERDSVFAEMERTANVYSTQYFSQIIIYIVAIAISLFNILSLYIIVVDMNEIQNKVMFVCGISAKKRLLLLIAELFLYSVVFVSLGLFASIWFVSYTDYIDFVTEPALLPYTLLSVGLLSCITGITLPGLRKSVLNVEKEG